MSAHTEPSSLTVFTYVAGSLDAADVGALHRSAGFGFTPTTVTIRAIGADPVELPYDDGVWDRIAGTADLRAVDFESGLLQPSLGWSWTPTHVQLWLADAPAPEGLLSALLAAPGLFGGAAGDGTDQRWQGETNPQHYRMWFDGPWEHLPRTTDRRGREIIDVSGNPGRMTDVPGMRLWAAQDVWFGPAAALVIDHAAIPGLDTALDTARVTDLGDGRWHVRLWEDGTPLPEIRRAQQAVRDQLGFDAALAREDELWSLLTAGVQDDPMFVAQEGTFPHGGTKRFLQYFSGSRHPTTRSRAAWLNIKEFDGAGQAVHDEYVDLTSSPHPEL